MTQTIGGGVASLRAAMAGAVLTPEDPEFEQARKVWNGDIDHHPAVIAHCISAQDVVDAILFAHPGAGAGGARWCTQHARLLLC